MPPKRRTSTPTAAAHTRRSQPTLSFGRNGQQTRITKPAATQQATKKAKKDPALFDDITPADATPDLEEPTTADAAIARQVEAETADALDDKAGARVEDVLGGRARESEAGATGGTLGSGWQGDEEKEARKVTPAHINAYWRAKERERKVPRVHQEGLSVGEKVLREWDMSGQYGPCIGIARLKRWKRANTLGLKPPIEVLAVLLKTMDSSDIKAQRAYVDELMSSRFIET